MTFASPIELKSSVLEFDARVQEDFDHFSFTVTFTADRNYSQLCCRLTKPEEASGRRPTVPAKLLIEANSTTRTLVFEETDGLLKQADLAVLRQQVFDVLKVVMPEKIQETYAKHEFWMTEAGIQKFRTAFRDFPTYFKASTLLEFLAQLQESSNDFRGTLDSVLQSHELRSELFLRKLAQRLRDSKAFNAAIQAGFEIRDEDLPSLLSASQKHKSFGSQKL